MYSPQLDAFIKAAETGSFSKATRAAYITPTSLIQQINLLESRLGIPLFNRSHGGVKLTKEGEIIYDAAIKIVQMSEEAVQQARALKSAKKLTIRIGLSTLINGRYLNTIGESIIADHPNISVEFVTMERRPDNLGHYLESLNSSKIDLLETVYYPGIYEGKADFLTLFETEFCIAVPPKHRLRAKQKITLDDLKGECVIVPWNITKNNENSAMSQAKRILLQNGIEFTEEKRYDLSVVSSAKLKKSPILIADAWADVFAQFRIFHLGWDIRAPYGIVYRLKSNRQILSFIQEIMNYWDKNDTHKILPE